MVQSVHKNPTEVPKLPTPYPRKAIPGAKLWLLHDAGRLVFVERFADVNREVVRFLRSGEGRGRGTGGGAAEQVSRKPEGWLCRCVGAARGLVARMRAAVRIF